MTDQQTLSALIYCRVSSLKQVEEGHGLDSQETRCRDYAKRKGYDVIGVYHDKGVSGGMIDRPGMRQLLSFLLKQNEGVAVIIDDLSRFSRDVMVHWQLRELMKRAGGLLECPTMTFGDTSDDKLVENLLASVSQHQREKNGEQTRNRMQARCSAGYWVFHAPIGYKYEKTKEHGKLLVKHEPIASSIKEALEGYASGRFETQAEVKRFLEAQPDYPKDKRGEVHQSRIMELLSRPIYAGFITHERWDLHLIPGMHEPIISLETWHKNQNRVSGGTRPRKETVAPIRKDTRPDFPLRGFVTCCGCDNPMTAAWSKGRSTHYGYYFCQTKGCSEFRKNIRKADIEGEFETLLRQLQPSQPLIEVAYDVLKDVWEEKRQKFSGCTAAVKMEIKKLEHKAATVMERLLSTKAEPLIKAYEAEIGRIEETKAVLTEKAANSGRPLASFEETYRTACEFLANPWKLWASDRLEDRRILLRLAFAGRIPYCREGGYRTAETTLPFKVLAGINNSKSGMVPTGGIEPPASPLPRECSTPELRGRSRRQLPFFALDVNGNSLAAIDAGLCRTNLEIWRQMLHLYGQIQHVTGKYRRRAAQFGNSISTFSHSDQ